MTYGNAGLLVTLGALLLSTTATAGEIEDKFHLYDTNRDGAISLSEHAAAIAGRFKDADTDHDGSLTVVEIFKDTQARSMAAGRAGGNEGVKLKIAEVFLKSLDTDGNGRISPAEYKVQGDRSFTYTDTNGDQRMTLEEMLAVPRARGGVPAR